jgi:hypothetical protein
MFAAQLSVALMSISLVRDVCGFRHTQIRQSVVEAHPSVVETLVCDCKPFGLIAQHLVSSGAQHPYVDLIQLPGILIDREYASWCLRPYPEWCPHARRRLLPSWRFHSFRFACERSR